MMASKRKSSKPTRIAKEDVVVYMDEGDGLPASTDEDDTMSKIQRFIEEGSEDTPDCLQRKLEQSPASKPTNRHEDVPPEFIPKMRNSESGERMFPDIFSNGHIPSNLKFHQLLNDEVDSIKKVSEELPTSRQEPVNGQNGNCYFTVVKAEKTAGTDESDEHLTFKQVSGGGHRKTSKRSKPCDDETPRYACSMCKYVTNRSDHHKRHLMTHSADKPLKCPKCSYGTGRSDHYKRHLQRHGLSEHEIINTCFRNGLKLKSAAIPTVMPENENHTNVRKENVEKVKNPPSVKATPPVTTTFPRAHLDKKFKCDQCSYSTDKSSHMTRHRNSHSNKALSRCNKCNKSYRASSNYHKCAKAPGHRCPKCAAIFEERAAMLRHILDRHGNDDALVSATKPVLRNMAEASLAVGETATTIVTVINDDDSAPALTVDDPGPIDLSVVPKHEGQGCDWVTDSKSNLGDKFSRKGGNMGCTKCGVWFDKYNDYTTHACVS